MTFFSQLMTCILLAGVALFVLHPPDICDTKRHHSQAWPPLFPPTPGKCNRSRQIALRAIQMMPTRGKWFRLTRAVRLCGSSRAVHLSVDTHLPDCSYRKEPLQTTAFCGCSAIALKCIGCLESELESFWKVYFCVSIVLCPEIHFELPPPSKGSFLEGIQTQVRKKDQNRGVFSPPKYNEDECVYWK